MKTFDITNDPICWDQTPVVLLTGVKYEVTKLGEYECLRLIGGIETTDPFEARKFLDKFYDEYDGFTGLAAKYADYSRGTPREFRFGDWWVICGFEFD